MLRAFPAFLLAALLLAPFAVAAVAEDVEDGLKDFVSSVEALVHEYGEADGYAEARDEMLPAVEQKWSALAPKVAATHAHEADEIGEAVGDLRTSIEARAPLADVEALEEAIEHEVSEVLGAAPAGDEGDFALAAEALHEKLESVEQAYEAGDKDAALAAVRSAYLDVYAPRLEARIAAVDAELNEDIEDLLNVDLKAAIQNGAPVAEVEEKADAVMAKVAVAQAKLEGGPSAGKSFFDSFLILMREGFEAMLVVGALVTYVVRTGRQDKAKLLYWGAAAAVVASLALYLVVRLAYASVPAAYREVLEGATTLLAVAVLFYVSYWLINKVETAKWNRFIQGKMKGALAKGSTSALVSVAFLAVFREGFETVLFYQGLAGAGASGLSIAAGVAAGAIVLAALGLGFYKFGVRVPLRPFFIATSALLYYLAFTFMGMGVHELQEAGVVSTTVLPALASLLALPVLEPLGELLGLFPTVETLAAQLVLILAIVGGLAYTFVLEPRRARDVDAVEA